MYVFRGMSTNNNLAAFRECYSHLHKFRALVPCKIIALTATATKATRKTIYEVLLLSNPKVIYESANKSNVAYSVKYMANDTDLEGYFDWLVEELKEKKEDCQRTIIYCQTIKQCSVIYSTLKGMLGRDMYSGDKNQNNVLLEILHSCTPKGNKENILSSFMGEIKSASCSQQSLGNQTSRARNKHTKI